MTDLEPVDLIVLAGFIAEVHPLMEIALAREGVWHVRDHVVEAAWTCTQSPYCEGLWGAGELYRAWMKIDDILGGWPVDYGADADDLAMREFGLAVQEWLDMPWSEDGFRDYVRRWRARVAQDAWPTYDKPPGRFRS
ncbi:hypothetical protein [Planobispora takensis]|uniref:Uncharacterized protein n=1 Tax=Planobispora takensis TaxID=1367882 RepID=A0A8J3SXL1_9ACTN|nr:hypothetical protein [Planobispora takensis]GII02068.1 hypothetical protein Pta02_40760 [Planobispora takensis]